MGKNEQPTQYRCGHNMAPFDAHSAISQRAAAEGWMVQWAKGPCPECRDHALRSRLPAVWRTIPANRDLLRLLSRMADRSVSPAMLLDCTGHYSRDNIWQHTRRNVWPIDYVVNGAQNHRWYAWAKSSGPTTLRGQVAQIRRLRTYLVRGYLRNARRCTYDYCN